MQSKPTEGASVDWIEHTSADGRKYVMIISVARFLYLNLFGAVAMLF